MSRVVNTNSPGKKRNHHMRTAGELIRHLSQKQDIDEEARDMLAALVYTLRAIDATIQDVIVAWEKRDYWVKAEKFSNEWVWVGMTAAELEGFIREKDWAQAAMCTAKMSVHFSAIKITKLVRPAKIWQGAYQRLLDEQSS